MEKKTLGILLLSSPYTHQNSHTLYELARSALQKGYGVKVFLFVDGVNNAKMGQDPDPDVPMNERFTELAEMGAEFQACGLCTSARGFDQKGSDFIEEVEVTGLTEFAEIVGECERFVTFSLNR
ncbi:MAG: DsrE family protein [Candidatus Thorarchaeota archaeon]|nr:MAG: DsrE family protein [Candidatus Thorarchaeota archaeon]